MDTFRMLAIPKIFCRTLLRPRGLGGNPTPGLLRAFEAVSVTLLWFSLAGSLLAWPTANEWMPVYRGGAIITDPNGDATGSRNVVSDSNNAAMFIFDDGTYLYFRMRLDQDPAGTGGQGLLKSFGWGVVFDTNMNPGNYEAMIMLDGISSPETIALWLNTVQGTLGDPSDKPEVLYATLPLSGNYQIVPANTSFNGDLDYFLDWRFPIATLKQATGLTDSTPIRLFGGSSSSANVLTTSGGDLIGASDLYAGFSDYILLTGSRPTTGTVRFVADLAGNGDVTQAEAGHTLFVRVDDGDQNYNPTTRQTVTVTLTTTNGDSAVITLTETGVNTGVFTGSILTTYGMPVTGNGVLEITRGETVTVSYLDEIDEYLNRNRWRTDTVLVLGPLISVAKTANLSSVTAGDTVIYTITITNTGTAAGTLTTVRDLLPSGFSYLAGSSSGVTTSDPSVNGQVLTWSGTWIVPMGGSVNLVFRASAGGIIGTFYNSVTVIGNSFPAASTGNTAPVTVTAPLISLQKTVDKAFAAPGEELTYAIHYRNIGNGMATTLVVMDSIPANTTYVSESLRVGGAGSTYATAAWVSDAADADTGQYSGGMVLFTIPAVVADDGVPDSGADEGKVYFKVVVR